MKRYMVAVEDRERIKTLLNKESVGWRKERLVALQMGFQPHHTIDDIGAVMVRGRLPSARLGAPQRSPRHTYRDLATI